MYFKGKLLEEASKAKDSRKLPVSALLATFLTKNQVNFEVHKFSSKLFCSCLFGQQTGSQFAWEHFRLVYTTPRRAEIFQRVGFVQVSSAVYPHKDGGGVDSEVHI